MFIRKLLSLSTILAVAVPMVAADDGDAPWWKKISVSASVQSDNLFPQDDETIKTNHYTEAILTNSYVNLSANSKYLDAGLRFEYLEHPLPGFGKPENPLFPGWGVPFYYLRAHFDKFEVTAGTFYEQFGSGFILRTYEQRSLGIDNSILGGKITVRPTEGVTVKLLSGKQRYYWELSDGLVSGADISLGLENWIKPLKDNGSYLTFGASWVNKYEDEDIVKADATHRLNLPKFVNAFDLRLNYINGGLNILGEYAWKTADPSFDNGYIYRKGNVAMLSATYSRKGLSALLQVKRSDNMSFRSQRDAVVSGGATINHLPAFTLDQTYALAALYPYATNTNGEWAYQAEFGYNFKKGTLLGGKYGTRIRANFSYVRGIVQNPTDGGGPGTDGYGSPFWRWGDQYYHDADLLIEKRFSKMFTLNFMYMNQYYNKTAVEGHGGLVRSNILIADAKFKLSRKVTLRAEGQYLFTDDDEGDWAYGLVELSLLPGWMFTFSDMYNAGVTNIHYYQGFVTYNWRSLRAQVGYGRTRAGYNCAGGVCRYIPAYKGVTISLNYNF